MSKAKFVFIKNVIILKQFVIDSSDKERIDIAKQELFLTDRNQILYIFLFTSVSFSSNPIKAAKTVSIFV